VYGFIFTLFDVDLTHNIPIVAQYPGRGEVAYDRFSNLTNPIHVPDNPMIPGPPFVFGAFLVLLAILVTAFIPELIQFPHLGASSSSSSKSVKFKDSSQYYYTSVGHQKDDTQCVSMMGASDSHLERGKSGHDDDDRDRDRDRDRDMSGHNVVTPKRLNGDDVRYEIYKRGAGSSDSQLPLMQDIDAL